MWRNSATNCMRGHYQEVIAVTEARARRATCLPNALTQSLRHSGTQSISHWMHTQISTQSPKQVHHPQPYRTSSALCHNPRHSKLWRWKESAKTTITSQKIRCKNPIPDAQSLSLEATGIGSNVKHTAKHKVPSASGRSSTKTLQNAIANTTKNKRTGIALLMKLSFVRCAGLVNAKQVHPLNWRVRVRISLRKRHRSRKRHSRVVQAQPVGLHLHVTAIASAADWAPGLDGRKPLPCGNSSLRLNSHVLAKDWELKTELENDDDAHIPKHEPHDTRPSSGVVREKQSVHNDIQHHRQD